MIDEEKLHSVLVKLAESIPYTNDYHNEDYLELCRMIDSVDGRKS